MIEAAQNSVSAHEGSGELEGKPTAVDLFSGCGGLTLGLKQAGFRAVGAVEIDPLAVETYRANHPEVSVWETDIRDLLVSEVKETLGLGKGQLDLLAGCPPCQGFSSMRTLNGSNKVEDSRNDLVFEFLRFLEELRPKAVMMENVPGLMKDKRLVVFRQRLHKLGVVAQSWEKREVVAVQKEPQANLVHPIRFGERQALPHETRKPLP